MQHDELPAGVRHQIAETAGLTSKRARDEREKARQEMLRAQRLRAEADRLLERARGRRARIGQKLEAPETTEARDAGRRADRLRESAQAAQRRSVAARDHSDAARERSDAAVERMNERGRKREETGD